MKKKKYKIKCKNCNDILESEVPIRNKIKCQCGNIAIYSDYIAYGMINNLPKEECFENLSKPLNLNEVKTYFDKLEK